MVAVVVFLGSVRAGARGWDTRGKAFADNLASDDDGNALGIVLPIGGVMLELIPTCTGLSR